MRSYLAKKVLPVIAVFGAACGGGAGSFIDDPVGALPVVLCATGSTADWRGWLSYYSPPLVSASWAAIQRENQSWHTIDATEAKVFLNPGERIRLARWLPAMIPLGMPSAEIFFVTAEQAQTAFPCDSSSRKSLHGTVQGLETGQGGYLSIGNSVRTFSNGPFTMDGVSPGMTDLVATRFDAPAKAILRRGVDYPNGSEISLLDFGSAEAVSLEPHSLAVNDATTQFEARSHIITPLGAHGWLSRDFATTGEATRTVTMYSVPESSLTNDDVQFLSVDPQDYRYAIVFYRHPADRTVTLGPGATTATGTHLGTALNRTLRLDMPSQPEYGAQVTFSLCSGGDYHPTATLLVTKEYFGGTPATWSVIVPDLASVQGFPGGDLRASNLCSVQSLTNLPFVFAPRTTHEGDAFTFLTYGINVSNK
jgi:hypothetical protein